VCVSAAQVVGQVLGKRDLLFEREESVRVDPNDKRTSSDGSKNILE
jgi:hypothetical protein